MKHALKLRGILWAAIVWPTITFADVKLPNVFGSHMVLQQQKPIVIWGAAEVGEAVTVLLGSQKQEAKANEKGQWQIKLPPLTASTTPLTLTVSGKNTIKLDDILIGEVWLCSGQSNMAMGVGMCLNAKEEIEAANYPQIRLLPIPKGSNPLPQADVNTTWKVCSPQTIAENGWGGFSAAAYNFGREIHKALNVPVGLIDSSLGGSAIEPWIPQEGFATVPTLKNLYEKALLADPRTVEHQQFLDKFLKTTEDWVVSARKAGNDKAFIPTMPIFPTELLPLNGANQAALTSLYNAMIHPLQPLSLRGILWYQGETNRADGALYTEKMKALVLGWRKVFEQDDLAFYYTLIAPYNYGADKPTILPEFWEAQAASMAIPNTGMIVTTDIGDKGDIHPKNKQEVGRRLSLWALAKTYGKSGIVYSGPTFKSLSIDGNKLRIAFDHVGGGLVARDGKPLDFFEIIDGEKGGFVPANAVIDGASVVLSADGVSKPVAMRFAWNKLAEPNLSNKEGLPAIPFRAGDAPNRDSFTLLGDETKDYQLVYDLDISKVGEKFVYDVDRRSELNGKTFDRVAYFLELTTNDGSVKYLYASMDAFTNDLSKIGVPTIESKAFFQKKVENLNVMSNVSGIVTGSGLKGGNIEFWPNNYGPKNSANIPNASNEAYDFGDEVAGNAPAGGFGSMQIHNFEAKQTLLAFNHWSMGQGMDLGIGNNPGKNPDWTFEANAKNYPGKRLRVYVRCK